MQHTERSTVKNETLQNKSAKNIMNLNKVLVIKMDFVILLQLPVTNTTNIATLNFGKQRLCITLCDVSFSLTMSQDHEHDRESQKMYVENII